MSNPVISSKRVEGTAVYNPNGDKLGSIDEIVIDKVECENPLVTVNCAALTETLLDRGLPREIAANRDALLLVVGTLKQDAPVTVTVRDTLPPWPSRTTLTPASRAARRAITSQIVTEMSAS